MEIETQFHGCPSQSLYPHTSKQAHHPTINLQPIRRIHHTVAPNKERNLRFLCFLLILLDKIIHVLQRFFCSSGLAPIGLLDRTPSESTLVPRKSLYPAFSKVRKDMIITFNVFAEAMYKQEEGNRCSRRLIR